MSAEMSVANDMRRFADNYRYISRMDMNRLPPALASKGLALRTRMRKAMGRMERSARVGDLGRAMTEQKQGVGFWPMIIGGSALTWLATKFADESDEYIAKASVIEQLIAAGISPERAAEIVLGKDKWPVWKVAAVSVAGAGAIYLGARLWFAKKRRV